MKNATVLALATISILAAAPPERTGTVLPNDPLWRFQLSLNNPGGTFRLPLAAHRARLEEFNSTKGVDSDIVGAWAITTGRRDIVVAFLEDGFFYGHEDLRENVWQNPGETGPDAAGLPKETNGVDDDRNGHTDDVVGWDFAFDDPDPDCYVFDGMDATRVAPMWHGTEVLGIVGAKGNNGRGLAGVCWDVSLMLLKTGAQGVRGPDLRRNERTAKAIRYAAANGARIINWSGFLSDERPETLASVRDAIRYAGEKGVLLVTGAGNSAVDIDLAENVVYPPCWDEPNILTVAQADFAGNLYTYEIDGRRFGSNWGRSRVHLAAVGQNYTTSVLHGRSVYSLGNGTSCATPVVSGIAALVLAVRPELKAEDLKRILLESATPLPAFRGKLMGGLVNARRALELTRNSPGAVEGR
jgi:subtilisin family serine protease